MRVNVGMLKDEMYKKHYSISKLAEVSVIDKATISRLLSEQSKCSVNTAQAIVAALDIQPEKAGKIFFGQ